MQQPKPGYKTTEFWATLAVEALLGVLATIKGGVTLNGLATVAYNLSRGLAKGGVIRGWLGRELEQGGTLPSVSERGQ